jgi:hypothetical protein
LKNAPSDPGCQGAVLFTHDRRPIRAETRAPLVATIARGRRWLHEVVAGTVTSVDQIATRDKCSIRQVNMTISLAFLAPELVKAAVEGRLPRGIGVTRLRDAPANHVEGWLTIALRCLLGLLHKGPVSTAHANRVSDDAVALRREQVCRPQRQKAGNDLRPSLPCFRDREPFIAPPAIAPRSLNSGRRLGLNLL